MPEPTSADPVVAYLDGIRERLARAQESSTAAAAGMVKRNKDAALLLAAVERVLEKHQPVLRGEPICAVCRLAADSNFEHPWPCPTYRAISEALTGKEGTDA